MARVAGHEPVYEVAERWVENALHRDDSLFTPGESIWSTENLSDLHQRFVGNPDTSGRGFIQKFADQLADAPHVTIQLAAEVLYVYYLIIWPGKIPQVTKRARIDSVLAWTRPHISLPGQLDSALDAGLIDLGPALGQIYASIRVIIEFCQRSKEQSEERRTNALSDPWKFKDDIDLIDFPYASTQKNALLHLVHPSYFEPITSMRNKRDILESFSNQLSRQSGDIDKDLLEIRSQLDEAYGEGFHFYDDSKRYVWDTSMSVLERFVRWGNRYVIHPTFVQYEIDPKLEAAGRIQQASSAFDSGSDNLLANLKQAFQKSNLVPFYTYDSFLKWCGEHQSDAKLALREIWSNQADIDKSVLEFSSRFPSSVVGGIGTRTRLTSFLAMAVDPHKYPIYMFSLFDKAYKKVGHSPPNDSADEATVYSHALGFLDKLMEEAGSHGLALQDRLYAQSMLWSMFSDGARKDVLPEVEHAAFEQFIVVDGPIADPPKFNESITHQEYTQNRVITPISLPVASGGAKTLAYTLSPELPAGLTFSSNARSISGIPTAAQAPTTYTYTATDEDGATAKQTFSITVAPETLNHLAARLFWDAKHLQDIHSLLKDKGQIVFYGPPGTGKTFVAQELARHFAGAEGSTDLVQFHPSYAYEDFVEGFRPADQNGRPGFQLREGPLKRIADKARANPDARHVLVIDEINRGNVARVFGELYFLLEYRDRKMSLQYSDDPFSLPKNLWFIATMNTADRSIALVDAALRRRFHFVPFFPDQPPVDGLLDRWLESKSPSLRWVADLLNHANAKLADRHLAIGPSHFMRKELDEQWVELIWTHSILPYIEEQLFGQEERLPDFKLATLRAEIEPPEAGANTDDDAASPAS
jgi:hypothetical protein